jgi:hypothetical protein
MLTVSNSGQQWFWSTKKESMPVKRSFHFTQLIYLTRVNILFPKEKEVLIPFCCKALTKIWQDQCIRSSLLTGLQSLLQGPEAEGLFSLAVFKAETGLFLLMATVDADGVPHCSGACPACYLVHLTLQQGWMLEAKVGDAWKQEKRLRKCLIPGQERLLSAGEFTNLGTQKVLSVGK